MTTGEWTIYNGGYDSQQCSHFGCNYFSTCPRPSNRRQAIQRHEQSQHIHILHFQLCRNKCDMCKKMLASDQWHPEIVPLTDPKALSRLKNKEILNVATPETIHNSNKRKRASSKTKKRKRQKGL